MANWDKKYFVTELQDVTHNAPWSPVFTDNEARRLLSLYSDVIKDAFYMETAWFLPGKWPDFKGPEGTIKPHTHEYDEVFAWVGSDPEDPYNLNGEIEVWVDGKQSFLNRSFIAFIPAGVVHGPINIRRIDKPMFHFTSGTGKMYRMP